MQHIAFALTQAHIEDLNRLADHPHRRAVAEMRRSRTAARRDARRRFYARVTRRARRAAVAGPEPWGSEKTA